MNPPAPLVGPNTATFSKGQTASGVAASLGMTPAQFLSYNPGLKATGLANDYKGLTGLVREGQSYNTGPTSSQIVTTSGPSRQNMAQNLSLYDKAVAGLGPVDNKPTPPPATGADPIISGLQRLQTSSDAMTKSLLASTMAQYQNKINEAKTQGENYKLGLESLGIKTGAAASTPDLLAGHIQAAANETMQKVSGIERDMNKALLDIKVAKDEGDFKNIQIASDRYRQLQKDKTDAINQLHDNIEFGQKQLTYDAPSLLASFNTLTDSGDKQRFIEEVAKRDGVSPISVIAAIKKAQAEEAKVALDTRNTESLIKERGKSGGGASTLSERNQIKINDIKMGLTSDGKNAPLDKNGYMTPAAWNYLVKNSGLSRQDLLEEFGNLLYTDNYQAYKITAKEYKDLTGEAP